MRQHRVPQEIMAVEFNLFGAMNIRQFGYVAGSGAIGYFMYLIMPEFIRLPIAILCVCFGLALAFLPIDERPLDQYVTNFLLTLRNPTRMVWKKTPRPPAFLTDPLEALKEKQKSAVFVGRKEGLAGSGVFTSDKKDEGVEELDEKSTASKNTFDENLLSNSSDDEKITAPTDYTPVQYKMNSENNSNMKPAPEIEKKENQSVNLTTETNVVAGKVVDESLPAGRQGGNPVAGAIVIIKNEKGMPVQAVKVNTRGEFIPKSSLSNGEYEVSANASGVIIEKKKVQLSGEIVPPIILSVVSRV